MNYKKELINKNSLDILKETELYLLNVVNSSNEGFVSEDGVVERWVGGINKEKYTKEIKEAAKIKRDYIKKQLDD